MKQLLVGTMLGDAVMACRDRLALLQSALFYPEAVGTLANDQLATRLVTALCKPNKIFLDIGAHIGSVMAAVMQRDAAIHIIAIEAIPEKIAHLRRKFPSASKVPHAGCSICMRPDPCYP